MSLMLHAGATPVSYDDLRAVPLPPPTDTHIPVAHHEIVELVRYTLGFYGHEIAEESHAVTPDGMRYFGLMSLRSPYGDYTDTVGLRNSNDRTFRSALPLDQECSFVTTSHSLAIKSSGASTP